MRDTNERWHVRVYPEMIPQFPGSAPARVLLSLLLHQNGRTGRCDPSITTIAQDTGLTRRGVLRAMAQIESVGLIERITSKGRRTAYRIIFKTSEQNDTSARNDTSAQSDTPTSEQSGIELVNKVTPEQPKNSQGEQPKAAAARAGKSDLEEAWSKESPADYPWIRDWQRFVASQIRKGEKPEPIHREVVEEDDLLRSIRASQAASEARYAQRAS